MAETDHTPAAQISLPIHPPDPSGQWIGSIDGTNNGPIRIDIDRDRPYSAAIYINDPALPFACEAELIHSGGIRFTASAHSIAYAPTPGSNPPTRVRAEVQINGNELTGTWETDLNTSGTLSAWRRAVASPGNADAQTTWKDFREWAFDNGSSGIIFRGHRSNVHPLVTSFHRHGRCSLRRFVREDVPELRRHVEAHLGQKFGDDPEETGCLWALAQHHGFPTPLLDWTLSPFIAAYFALVWPGRIPVEGPDAVARIFALDLLDWEYATAAGEVSWDDPSFRIARLDLHARHNERLLPQRSVHTFSNLYDIEDFIKWAEGRSNRRRLWRFDIPNSEAGAARRDLTAMGITAGSLFPGIEGVCRGLAERLF